MELASWQERYAIAGKWILHVLGAPEWGTPQAWVELVVVLLAILGIGSLILSKVCGNLRGVVPGMVGLALVVVLSVLAAASVPTWVPPSMRDGAAGPWMVLAGGVVGLLVGTLLCLRWLTRITAGQALAGVVLTAVVAVGAVVLERTLWTAVAGSLQKVEQSGQTPPGD